jgi:ArsR family transcriptional regulator
MADVAIKHTSRAEARCCTPRVPSTIVARAAAAFTQVFRALGDETRLEMLGLLAAAGTELCVCDIEAHFKLSQPTISHHLRILREAALVTAERRGTWVYYALDKSTLRRLPEFVALLGG